MNNLKFTVEDIFGKLDLSQNISAEQIQTLTFFSRNSVNIKIKFRFVFILFKPK